MYKGCINALWNDIPQAWKIQGNFLLFSSINSFVQPLTVLELYATIERVCWSTMVQSIARASTLNPLWLVIELHMSSLITVDSYNNNNNLLHAQAKLLLLHILSSFCDILILVTATISNSSVLSKSSKRFYASATSFLRSAIVLFFCLVIGWKLLLGRTTLYRVRR